MNSLKLIESNSENNIYHEDNDIDEYSSILDQQASMKMKKYTQDDQIYHFSNINKNPISLKAIKNEDLMKKSSGISQDNNSKDQLQSCLKSLYINNSKIPPLIDDMEGMHSYDMKDYYVKLKTVIQQDDKDEQVGFDQIGGEKINIEVENIFDKLRGFDIADKILIIGGAGVGKSTLMQYMAYKWSKDELWKSRFDLVYRVPLKTLLNSSWKQSYNNSQFRNDIDKHPLKYLIHFNILRIAEEGGDAKKLTPEDIILNSDKKIVLLLDGYDEVTHLKDDTSFKNLLDDIFQQKYIILTSRPNAVDISLKGKFNRVIENTGLDNFGVEQFINLQFKDDNPMQKGLKLAVENLLQNPQIKNICKIPVNLAMLCYLITNKDESKTKININNSCQLYQQVIQKLGERFISKEFRGSAHEGQSLSEKMQLKMSNLHEIKAIRHIAYIGLTGGGIGIDDSQRQETLIIPTYSDNRDKRGKSIQSSIEELNLKTNINRIIKFGLLKQEGIASSNTEYSFIHLSFQEYLTAEYLVDKLNSKITKETEEIIRYISQHRNEPRLLMTLKFMCGIISLSNNEYSMKDFWNSMICNIDGMIEFSLDGKIRLIMNLLGQAYLKNQQNNLQLDQRIPNLSKIINLVDMVVISNYKEYRETIKDSKYISERMERVLDGFLEGKDKRKEILELIKNEYFLTDQEIINSNIPADKQNMKMKQLVGYIFQSFIENEGHSQDESSSNENSSQDVKKQQILMQIGLEIASSIPQKIKIEKLELSILSLLKSHQNLQAQKVALTLFNQIFSTIKVEKGSLHNEIKNFLLNLRGEQASRQEFIEGDDIMQEQKLKAGGGERIQYDLLEISFSTISQIIELDVVNVIKWSEEIFSYCLHHKLESIPKLIEALSQKDITTKAIHQIKSITSQFGEKSTKQIFKFINSSQSQLSIETVFQILPNIILLVIDESLKYALTIQSIDLFLEFFREKRIINNLKDSFESLLNILPSTELNIYRKSKNFYKMKEQLNTGNYIINADSVNFLQLIITQVIDSQDRPVMLIKSLRSIIKYISGLSQNLSLYLFEQICNLAKINLKDKQSVAATTEMSLLFISLLEKHSLQLGEKIQQTIFYVLKQQQYENKDILYNQIISGMIKQMNQPLSTKQGIKYFEIFIFLLQNTNSNFMKENLILQVLNYMQLHIDQIDDDFDDAGYYRHYLLELYQIIGKLGNSQKKELIYTELLKQLSFEQLVGRLQYWIDNELNETIFEILLNLTNQHERQKQYIQVYNKYVETIDKCLINQDKYEKDAIPQLSSLKFYDDINQFIQEFMIILSEEYLKVNLSLNKIITSQIQKIFQQKQTATLKLDFFHLLFKGMERAILFNQFYNTPLNRYTKIKLFVENLTNNNIENIREEIFVDINSLLFKEKQNIIIGKTDSVIQAVYSIHAIQGIDISKMITEQDTICNYMNFLIDLSSEKLKENLNDFILINLIQFYNIVQDKQKRLYFIDKIYQLVILKIKEIKDSQDSNSSKDNEECFKISEQFINNMNDLDRKKQLSQEIIILLQYKSLSLEQEKKFIYFNKTKFIFFQYLEIEQNITQFQIIFKIYLEILENSSIFTGYIILAHLNEIMKKINTFPKDLNLGNSLVKLFQQEKKEILQSNNIFRYISSIVKQYKDWKELKDFTPYLLSLLDIVVQKLDSSNAEALQQQAKDICKLINKLSFTELVSLIQKLILKLQLINKPSSIQNIKIFQFLTVIIKNTIRNILKSNEDSQNIQIISIQSIEELISLLNQSYDQQQALELLQIIPAILQISQNTLNIKNYVTSFIKYLQKHDQFNSEMIQIPTILNKLEESREKNRIIEILLEELVNLCKVKTKQDQLILVNLIAQVLSALNDDQLWVDTSIKFIQRLVSIYKEQIDIVIITIHLILNNKMNIHPSKSKQIIDLIFTLGKNDQIRRAKEWYLIQFKRIIQNYIILNQIENLKKKQNMKEEFSILFTDSFFIQNLIKDFKIEFKTAQIIFFCDIDQNISMQKYQYDQYKLGEYEKKGTYSSSQDDFLKFLQEQQTIIFEDLFGQKPYEMILIILNIISFENEELSDRSELIKEGKILLRHILKRLDKTGINWVLKHIHQLSILSSQSKMVVLKTCDILFEDGIISDNSNLKNGVNEYKILIDIINSNVNITFSSNNSLNVEGIRYNLIISENGKIALDKELSNLIRSHRNPFITQYSEYVPLFQNSNFVYQSILDRKECSIIDNNLSYESKLEFVRIDSEWRLVELNAFNGDKIVFFEKRDCFGKRIICRINMDTNPFQINKILDNDRIQIFGSYQGPQMFYAKIEKNPYQTDQAEFSQNKELSNVKDWNQIKNDEDFLICYQQYNERKKQDENKFTNQNNSIDESYFEQKLFTCYHDALLHMELTCDRMQDIVYFEFTRTIRDQQEVLKHELTKLAINQDLQNCYLEYYNGFIKTFSLCYTEAQVIVSGKFDYDVSSTSVTIVSKLASCIPLIGDIASTTIQSVGEFFNGIEIKRNANTFLQFASDHTDLSKKSSEIVKQIIIKKFNELRINNFEVGYMELADQKINNHQIKKQSNLCQFKEKVLQKIESINQYIESTLYGDLYEGKYAQLGNDDASQFIQLYCKCMKEKKSSPSSSAKSINLLQYIQNDIKFRIFLKSRNNEQKNNSNENKNSCNCSIF